jgi:hypothetical protein
LKHRRSVPAVRLSVRCSIEPLRQAEVCRGRRVGWLAGREDRLLSTIWSAS